MRTSRFVFVASALIAASSAVFAPSSADAGVILNFADASGLAGEAEFTIINPTTLEIRLRNTSTGVPAGFDSSDQLLTSIAFHIGGGITITGGSVAVGPTSSTVNFSLTNVGPGGDVSGEWGFGNSGGTGFGSLSNVVSTLAAGTTPFGPINLDGRPNLNGPQGGLVASPALVSLGGLGAIQDEIVATLTLSGAISDLSFLDTNIPIIEFGSDAAFIPAPAPGALGLLMLAGIVGSRRRRR